VSATSVFGALAVALSFLFVWPQVIRLARSHDTDGVSAVSSLWAGTGYALWVAYGLRNGLPAVTIANSQLTVGFTIITVMVLRYGPPVPRLVPAAALVAAAVAALSVLAPPQVPGIVAVAVASSAFLPQAYASLTRDDLSGVSVPTYLLITAACTSWLIFGILEHDIIVAVPSILVAPVTLLIAFRASRSVDTNRSHTSAPA
jgi:uncharacterized protein with PQ loop repeat